MNFKVHFKKCIKLINQDNNNLAELIIDLHVSFIVDVIFYLNKNEDYYKTYRKLSTCMS